jgi:hypothetical protein
MIQPLQTLRAAQLALARAGRRVAPRGSRILPEYLDMNAVVRSWAALLLLAPLCGCRMCQSPFDYCNPMIGPSGSLNCDFDARRASAFHPMADDPPLNLLKANAPEPGTSYEMGVPDPAAERGYDPSASLPDEVDSFVE